MRSASCSNRRLPAKKEVLEAGGTSTPLRTTEGCRVALICQVRALKLSPLQGWILGEARYGAVRVSALLSALICVICGFSDLRCHRAPNSCPSPYSCPELQLKPQNSTLKTYWLEHRADRGGFGALEQNGQGDHLVESRFCTPEPQPLDPGHTEFEQRMMGRQIFGVVDID